MAVRTAVFDRIAAAEQFLVAAQIAVVVQIAASAVQIVVAVRIAASAVQIAAVAQIAVAVHILVAVRTAVQVAVAAASVEAETAIAAPVVAGKAPDIVDYKRSTPQAAVVGSVVAAAAARVVGSPEVGSVAGDAKVDDAGPAHHYLEGCTPYYFHMFPDFSARQSWDQDVISHHLGHP